MSLTARKSTKSGEKQNRPTKSKKLASLWHRKDWRRLHMRGFIFVGNGGERVNSDFELVLQLEIIRWEGSHESWTVFRSEIGASDGKVVFRRWEAKVDEDRFLALGGKG